MKSAMPCSKHKIAFGTWNMVEMEAMRLKKYEFKVCKKCNWIIPTKKV